MERISSNGEVFVKASSIARELGYTADYVGQLCRSGQVEAQLVGRSWFVNEDSIREHKRNRYRSTKAKSQKMVRESLGHTSGSSFAATSRPAPRLNVRYETDESDVIPTLGSKLPAEESKVDLHDNEPDNVENVIPLRFEAESVPDEQNDDENDVESDESDDVYVVPLRKPAPEPLRRPDIVQTRPKERIKQAAPAPAPEEETQPVMSNRAERIVLAASLATAVAIIGAVTLIGLESHILVDTSGSLDTYQFNLASAMDGLRGNSAE